jgi:hypothetical protein
MAITKMQSPISFKMAVTSQLCFTHSSSLSSLFERVKFSITRPPLCRKQPFPTSVSFHNPTPSGRAGLALQSPTLLYTLDIFAPILFFSRRLVFALLSPSLSYVPALKHNRRYRDGIPQHRASQHRASTLRCSGRFHKAHQSAQ